MKMSSLRLALVSMYLLSAVGVISCGRPHVVLNSALEESRNVPFGEEIPERLTLPDLQWMLSNNEIAPIQIEEAPHSRMDLVRRDNKVTTKPLNCLNYFWKSRTAC